MNEVDVIVVGGGLAGLGAAKTLCEHGGFSVVLLEADSSVGGRVKTCFLPDGTPVPLGAASFHGKRGNSLFEFAEIEGLTDSIEVFLEQDSVLHTFSGGKEIPNKTIEDVEEKVSNMIEEVSDCFKTGDWSSLRGNGTGDCAGSRLGPPNVDLHDFLFSEMVPFLQARGIPLAVIEGVLKHEGITEGCKSMHGLDLATYGVWEYLDENTDVMYRDNPYHRIVHSLAAKIPANVIQINKEVCFIGMTGAEHQQSDVNGTSGTAVVTAKCKDGSNYTARHLIYTCSLGVLKNACSSNVFVPVLPPQKVTAIRELGFSLVNKVFMQFDAPLLSGKYDQLQLYWSDKDLQIPLISCNKWILGLQYFRLLPSKSEKFIYHTFFLQEDAAAIEQLQEREVANVILGALHHFLPQSLPKLLAVKVTHWGKTYTHGSYSYTPHGTTVDKREELSNPVGENAPLQILFAGEATSIDQFGCAHSAFDTGVREAERLIKFSSQHTNN